MCDSTEYLIVSFSGHWYSTMQNKEIDLHNALKFYDFSNIEMEKQNESQRLTQKMLRI